MTNENEGLARETNRLRTELAAKDAEIERLNTYARGLACTNAENFSRAERTEAAVAEMRERCAKIVEERDDGISSHRFVVDGRALTNEKGEEFFISKTEANGLFRSRAAAIRALPLPNETAEGGDAASKPLASPLSPPPQSHDQACGGDESDAASALASLEWLANHATGMSMFEWSEHSGKIQRVLEAAARRAAQPNDATPYCIGQYTLDKLRDEGAWKLPHITDTLVAASDLFRKPSGAVAAVERLRDTWLKKHNGSLAYERKIEAANEILMSLRTLPSAPEPAQEPVAYQMKLPGEGVWRECSGPVAGPDFINAKVRPLYAAPLTQPVATWCHDMDAAPKDRMILVYAAPYDGLKGFVASCSWNENAGFCVDELRRPIAWMPLPAPPSQEPPR